jgi:GNAT superfamily N-acetyltransferase
LEAFVEAVAPLYPPEGIATFQEYAQAGAIQARDGEGHMTFVAEQDKRITGMLHVRTPAHLAMLFVLPNHQRTGLARSLLETADRHARILSVNASPNAVPAYEKLGFAVVGEMEQHKGMWVVPMRRR